MKTDLDNASAILKTVALLALCVAAGGFAYGYAIGRLTALNFALATIAMFSFSALILFGVPVEK